MSPGFTVYKEGFTFNILPFVICSIKAAVNDLYTAIITQRVFSTYFIQTAFEGMIKPGNLVPFAEVFVNIKTVNRIYIFR